MNIPLSPVEALRQEINGMESLRSTVANIDGVIDRYLAALELAKCVAKNVEITPTVIVVKLNKLVEALQQ